MNLLHSSQALIMVNTRIGNWYTYGQQPTQYVATWRRMSGIMRSRAPRVALVWSPNHSGGYPFGANTDVLLEADRTAMDTNRDGVIDFRDDPFTPFYPGNEHVDVCSHACPLYFDNIKLTLVLVCCSGSVCQFTSRVLFGRGTPMSLHLQTSL
jgi:hypothetical protein